MNPIGMPNQHELTVHQRHPQFTVRYQAFKYVITKNKKYFAKLINGTAQALDEICFVV